MRWFLLAIALACSGALAGEADVVDVKVRRSAPGAYDFDLTVPFEFVAGTGRPYR
jgi:hypothetical protein